MAVETSRLLSTAIPTELCEPSFQQQTCDFQAYTAPLEHSYNIIMEPAESQIEKLSVFHDHTYVKHECLTCSACFTQTRKFFDQNKYQRKINLLNNLKNKLKKKNMIYKKQLNIAKQSRQHCVIKHYDKMTAFQKDFFHDTLKANICKKRGHKWSPAVIHFGLQMYFQGTAAYKTLNAYFKLP